MACRVLTLPGMNSSCCRWGRLALLIWMLWGGASGSVLAQDPETATRDVPEWLSRTDHPGASSPSHYRSATLRSLGALLLLIGALAAVNRWLRHRPIAGQPMTEASLRVQARLRLGVRQEVVVVEWGGDQMVLGVGP